MAHHSQMFETIEHRLSFREFHVHPLSDVHIEARGHAGTVFEEKIAELKRLDDSHRVLLLGDLADIAIRHSVSFSHGAKTPDDALDDLCRNFEPIAHKVDLIIPGNHENRIGKHAGLDYTKQFAARLRLGEKYRPHASVVKYFFYERADGSGKQRANVELFCHHGYGGGRKVGSKLDKCIGFRGIKADCDAYLMGHVHERAHAMKMCVSGWPPAFKRQHFVLTGCYLGSEGYGKDFAFDPPVVGSPVLKITHDGYDKPAIEVKL